MMSRPTPELATAAAAERRRVWRLYGAGLVDAEMATLQLLRIDLAVRRACRSTAASSTHLVSHTNCATRGA
jgi:hypothetical protein